MHLEKSMEHLPLTNKTFTISKIEGTKQERDLVMLNSTTIAYNGRNNA